MHCYANSSGSAMGQSVVSVNGNVVAGAPNTAALIEYNYEITSDIVVMMNAFCTMPSMCRLSIDITEIPEGCITFYITNQNVATTYLAKSGMTWSEWVKSEYNTGGYVSGGFDIYNADATLAIKYNGTSVKPDNTIVANGWHTLGTR